MRQNGRIDMNRQLIRVFGIFAGISALCLPALAGEKDDAQTPDPRIGDEVKRICFQGNINGWRPVKGEDDVVLLNRGANRWYRVELLGGCRERLFRSALAIGIDSRPGGGCVSRGDVIVVSDGPGFKRRCSIMRMYEWDDDATAPEAEDDETSDEDS